MFCTMLYEKSPKNIERERRRGCRATFFDFSWDASRETPTFEMTVGRSWSENCLKSKRSVRCCPTKLKKKHNARAPPRAKSDDPLSKNSDFATRPRIHRIQRIPRKRCQQLRRRPSLTHAPGVRMTVVTQTPSN